VSLTTDDESQKAVQEEEDSTIEIEPKITPAVENKKGTPSAASKAQNSASLMVLKQQIQISNLQEELHEVKGQKKELEAEVSAKNQEIYDLNGKVLNYEHQLTELTTKNVETLENYRLKLNKASVDNQENRMAMNRFLTAIDRLKNDLHFIFISKNLKMADIAEKGVAFPSGHKETKEEQELRQQQQNKEDMMGKGWLLSRIS